MERFGLHTCLFGIFLVSSFRSNTVSFESHKEEGFRNRNNFKFYFLWYFGGAATHLLLNCEVASNVRRKVSTWLVSDFLTPPDLFVHLDCWTHEVNLEKLRKGFWHIWHAVI